jgi:hypothetical protein
VSRLSILPLLAIAVTACSSNTSLPSATAPSGLGSSVSAGGRSVSSIRAVNSCPTDVPIDLTVYTNGSGGVTAKWDSVEGSGDYLLEISRRDEETGEYINVDPFPIAEQNAHRSFALKDTGHYQARVRTHSCEEYGPWSAPVEFSIAEGFTTDNDD